jgi:hypothetical protein
MKTFLEFITESLSHLREFLSKNFKMKEYYFGQQNALYINITKFNWEKVLTLLKPIERTYKYFLSGYHIDFYGDDEEVDYNEFRKDIVNIIKEIIKNTDLEVSDDEILITLHFEPYYGEKITDIPDILYHITDENNISDIKSKGLLPRNTNKISYHPRRVYLLKDKKDIDMIVKYVNFNIDDPIILTIDVSKIKNDLRFYKDVNYPNGLFIDQRISPKYIIDYKNNKTY